MPGSISSLFSAIGTPKTGTLVNRHLPMLNEVHNLTKGYLFSQNQIQKKKALMRWCKNTPELNAFLNKLSIDITSNWHFEPVNAGDSGRNKLMKANKFAMKNYLGKIMQEQVYDILGLGEGYGWIGKILKEQIDKELQKILNDDIWIEKKQKESLRKEILQEVCKERKITDDIDSSEDFDEALLVPRKYRYVPSSTVEVLFNLHDITSYNQIINVHGPINYKPEEMIHYTFMERDGKVNGFTNVESVLVQLELLRLMWQNMISIYKNGGAPDHVFILENTRINTPEYNNMEQQLQKYKLVENKHGNMLFTGKVNIETLEQLDEMQFKDSGLYVTGVLAMQWGIPRSSIPFIIGGTNTKDDTGGNSERGYWQVVSTYQKTFAQDMNTQLWIPHFGVKIVFENPYIHLDVQKQTALQLKLNNIQQMDTVLMKDELQLEEKTRLKMLGLSSQDVTKVKMLPMLGSDGNTMDNQPNSDQVNKPDNERNVSDKKRTEQLNSASSTGMQPTGVGKEIKIREFNDNDYSELKEMIGNDALLVDFNNFVRLYNEDKAYHSGKPPRIFLKENPEFVTMKYKSTDFVYKTVIERVFTETDSFKIALSNLGNNIVRL